MVVKPGSYVVCTPLTVDDELLVVARCGLLRHIAVDDISKALPALPFSLTVADTLLHDCRYRPCRCVSQLMTKLKTKFKVSVFK